MAVPAGIYPLRKQDARPETRQTPAKTPPRPRCPRHATGRMLLKPDLAPERSNRRLRAPNRTCRPGRTPIVLARTGNGGSEGAHASSLGGGGTAPISLDAATATFRQRPPALPEFRSVPVCGETPRGWQYQLTDPWVYPRSAGNVIHAGSPAALPQSNSTSRSYRPDTGSPYTPFRSLQHRIA